MELALYAPDWVTTARAASRSRRGRLRHRPRCQTCSTAAWHVSAPRFSPRPAAGSSSSCRHRAHGGDGSERARRPGGAAGALRDSRSQRRPGRPPASAPGAVAAAVARARGMARGFAAESPAGVMLANEWPMPCRAGASPGATAPCGSSAWRSMKPRRPPAGPRAVRLRLAARRSPSVSRAPRAGSAGTGLRGLLASLEGELPPGYVSELCLRVEPWIAS